MNCSALFHKRTFGVGSPDWILKNVMLFLDFAFFILEQNIRGFDTLLLSVGWNLFLSERLELQIFIAKCRFCIASVGFYYPDAFDIITNSDLRILIFFCILLDLPGSHNSNEKIKKEFKVQGGRGVR